MKRILLFTENLGSGGAERQLTGLAVMLRQRGFHVVVLTYLDNQFQERYLDDNEVQHVLDVRILNKSFGLYSLYKNIKYLNPDTVISFLPAPNKRMCLMRFVIQFNLIVSERSHTQHWNISSFMKFLLYARADHMVANSFSELDNIVSHCPWLKNKSCAIPNCIDADKFLPSIDSRDFSNRLLCIGRLIPSKNVLRLLDAIYEIRQKGFRLSLKWVGAQYDKSYLSKVNAKIEELHLCDCVILKDQTDEVLKEYHSADVFCFPTLFEGYPNVLVEAMSCGLPVVCSNVCEMPNVVEEGVNGLLFNPLDTNDMVEAITRMLMLSQSDLKAMGLRNRIKVLENNSKKVFVDRYVSII